MHLTAVCFGKMLNFLHYKQKGNVSSCKVIDHPTLLECGVGDRAHRFKHQQKTAILLFR